jgi:hypothetical protein
MSRNLKDVAIWLLELAGGAFVGFHARNVSSHFPAEHQAAVEAGVYVLIAAGVLVVEAMRRRWRPRLLRLYYRWKLVELTGISRAFPVKPYPEPASGEIGGRNEDQSELVNLSLRGLVSTSTSLDLLLVSGAHYIGSVRRPGVLYKELFECPRQEKPKLRVLLLDPDGEQTIKRAKQRNVSVEEYKSEIHAVIWTLSLLKTACGMDVEVSLYSEVPIWQMIMSQNELWLLCARRVPAQDSPVYCLQRHGRYSLAWGLEGVWERRWEAAKRVDLSKVSAPDWSRIQTRNVA